MYIQQTCIYYLLFCKRPIMSVNFKCFTSTDYTECQNKILKIKEMLALNKFSQMKLKNMKQGMQIRMKELQEIGVIQNNTNQINQIFSSQSAINCVKKTPTLLEDQLLLKKNSVQQYGFLKNMVEDKQTKIRKSRKIKPNQVEQQLIGPDPRAINFVGIAQKYGKTGLQLYKTWREKYKPKQQKNLSINVPINEARLIQKRKIYGDDWEKIGYFFNGLSFEQLYYYFQKNLSNKKPGKWNLRQNLILIAVVQYYGIGKWAPVSKKLKQKSQFQIRQRFCNVLDPSIKQNKWSVQQQNLLLNVASLKKYKWSKIAQTIPQFSNKTDNALRRKFRNLMIKKEDDQIRELIKDNEKLQKSIIKFKKDYYNRGKKNKTNVNTVNKFQQQL